MIGELLKYHTFIYHDLIIQMLYGVLLPEIITDLSMPGDVIDQCHLDLSYF